jgi:hypothetical protein
MHLTTSWAAVALQPYLLEAGMREIPRLFFSIFRGVPPAYDAGELREGNIPPLRFFLTLACIFLYSVKPELIAK